MSKFIRKSVVIDAVQNDGRWIPIIEWLDSLSEGKVFKIPFGEAPPIVRNKEDGSLIVHNRGRVLVVNVGDWIVRDSEGYFYPCTDEVFKSIYKLYS